MTTNQTNGNGSTPDAQTPAIDTDALREIASAQNAPAAGGSDTGTAPMSAVPGPVVEQSTIVVPPPREPGLDEPEHATGDRETNPDHVPGTVNPRTTRKIVLVALGLGALAALLIGIRLFTGTATEGEVAGASAPQPALTAATVVPKDTDATECATMGVSTDTFRNGWCKGRAPGAYLLADDTMAYCSCAKPRKVATSGK